MADDHAVAISTSDHLCQGRHPVGVGLQRRDAEPVEAQIAATSGDSLVVVGIGRPARVAHDDPLCRDSGIGQHRLLQVPEGAFVRVGGDGRAGRQRGGGRCVEDPPLVVGHVAQAGSHLQDSRSGAAPTYPVGQLRFEHLGHHRRDVLIAGLERPVGVAALRLLVEAGGADDVEAGGLRHLDEQRHVPPEVVGARVHERGVAEVLELGDPVHAHRHDIGPGPPDDRGVALGARPAHGQVLVHQRAAQVVRANRSCHRLDHGFRSVHAHGIIVAGARVPGHPPATGTT